MQQFIVNPKSGRRIMVDGPTYQTLKRAGVPVTNRQRFPVVKEKKVRPVKITPAGPDDDHFQEIMGMPIFDVPDLASLAPLARTPAQKKRFQKLKANQNRRRGSATRGVSLRAPPRGKARKKLAKQCGRKCFLGVDDKLSFPICPRCDMFADGNCLCEIDCEMATAAFARSQQWRHPRVSRAAQLVLKDKCERKPRTGVFF